MNIIGKEVTHIKYGCGTIVNVIENKMQVDFISDKRFFTYPESFERFFSIADAGAKKYIDGKLDEMNILKRAELEKKEKEREKEEQFRVVRSKLKIKANSQAVFEVSHDEWTDVMDTWSIYTGKHLTGINKGKSRVPKNLNMNSACVLTIKPDGGTEKDRFILGIFMTPNNFIGEDCTTGIIPAHEKYRIVWEAEEEKLLFWDYFSDDAKMEKWGNINMKIISNTLVKKILGDMITNVSDKIDKKTILEFYNYFCKINQLEMSLLLNN